MVFYHLLIINKAGGLIYDQRLSPAAPQLGPDDTLRLGSTFHGLHAIAAQVTPLLSAGIETLEADTFRLQCFQTRTGTKFVLTASPGTSDLNAVLRGIYELYADYVLKCPFYELEMPIRVDLFQAHVTRLVEGFQVDGGRRRHASQLD